MLTVPCALFSSDPIEPTVRYGLRVRGQDLGAQGGSATGCGIPPEATSVILNLKVKGAQPGGRIKLWAADGPEPGESVLEGTDPAVAAKQGTVVVALSDTDGTGEDLLLRSTQPTNTRGEVIGYFRAMRAGDGPAGGVSFSTEGTDNNFFGDYAGFYNTTGTGNAFFGGSAGQNNTTGDFNSFFGHAAGQYHTTGSQNAFFGAYSGRYNEGDRRIRCTIDYRSTWREGR